MRAAAARGPGWLGVALACLAACAPQTTWRVLPPRSEASPAGGAPIYAATLPRVSIVLDGRPLPPDPEVTRSYVRALRRASLFTDVAGPEGPAGGDRAVLALASRLAVGQRAGRNLVRSILIGASLTLLRSALPYRVDVDGEMKISLRLPGTGELLEYRASSGATRSYFHANEYPPALNQLVQEVTNANLRSIIAQMRSDPVLSARSVLPAPP